MNQAERAFSLPSRDSWEQPIYYPLSPSTPDAGAGAGGRAGKSRGC